MKVSEIYVNKKLQFLSKSIKTTQMRAEKRQMHIASFLKEAEFASLEELSGRLGVSVSTVRRDVDALETEGNVRRTHGGARWLPNRSDEYAFTVRNTRSVREKESIARACAEQIQHEQTVIMDAGSTIFQVARHLESRAPQIITNSLPIANLYSSSSSVEVIVSGGVIYPRLGVLVGPMAVEAFSKTHADVAIMSASGLTHEGIFNSHALLIDMQRTMIASSTRVVFCLDHTKLNHRSLFFLTGLRHLDCLITDWQAQESILDDLRCSGIEVIRAPDPG
ncbi:MAG: DeoR/GlpR transcriptional regulator [Verrucomicrobia bacterium]|nr:MAG: DeoR/GlpR transcriptional regulator [Verrucomicrobiota bacterium]